MNRDEPPVSRQVYAALATDTLGQAVRLEQERVNFTSAEAALRRHDVFCETSLPQVVE